MSKIGFRAWNVPCFAAGLVQSASRPDLSQGRTLFGAGLDWELLNHGSNNSNSSSAAAAAAAAAVAAAIDNKK